MKIKLFYKQNRQTLADFEKEVNEFMESVTVVDVKYTEALPGDLDSYTGLLVLYR